MKKKWQHDLRPDNGSNLLLEYMKEYIDELFSVKNKENDKKDNKLGKEDIQEET